MRRAICLMFAPIALSACATTPGTAPVAAAGTPTKPVYTLSQIEGKDGPALDALLGAPDLARTEGAGEFRRYALATCSLLLVLYPDETGVRRVKSVSAGAVNAGMEDPDLDACLARGKTPQS